MQLKPEIETLLNEQINLEWYAHYFYKALSNWADYNAFPGLKGWADKASDEELEHANMFIEYLNDRGKVTLAPITAPQNEFGSYILALQSALEAEQKVSAALEKMCSVSMSVSDFPTFHLASNWLQQEQVGAEKELQDYIKIVSRGASVDLLDAELYD